MTDADSRNQAAGSGGGWVWLAALVVGTIVGLFFLLLKGPDRPGTDPVDPWVGAAGSPVEELLERVGPPSWDSREAQGDSEKEYMLRFEHGGEVYTVIVGEGVVVAFSKSAR